MIKMSKFKIDYAGNNVWANNKQFIAKERTPVHFQRTSMIHYRQLGNVKDSFATSVLVQKTSPRTGYIVKLALNK